MFLYYILSRDEGELISKIFWAQVNNPVKNDWSGIVRQDLEDFGIDYTFQQNQRISQTTFKTLIKEQMNLKALESLNAIKQDKSKLNKLNYKELKLQEYLTSSNMSIRQKKLAFQTRTHMLRTASNFRPSSLSAYLPSDHIGLEGKRLQLQPRSPLEDGLAWRNLQTRLRADLASWVPLILYTD